MSFIAQGNTVIWVTEGARPRRDSARVRRLKNSWREADSMARWAVDACREDEAAAYAAQRAAITHSLWLAGYQPENEEA